VDNPGSCRRQGAALSRAVLELGGLDMLVNNAAEQHPQESIEAISGADCPVLISVACALLAIRCRASHDVY
jgi:hypothetical protein